GGMAMPDFSLRYLSRVLFSAPHITKDLFTHIRFIYCGAEPIRFETIDRFIATTQPLGFDPHALFFCYGLAEATLLVSGSHFDRMETSFHYCSGREPVACVGRALGNTEIRIGESNSGDSESAQTRQPEGPIYVRGPSVIAGYWQDRPLSEGAWFATGD